MVCNVTTYKLGGIILLSIFVKMCQSRLFLLYNFTLGSWKYFDADWLKRNDMDNLFIIDKIKVCSWILISFKIFHFLIFHHPSETGPGFPICYLDF